MDIFLHTSKPTLEMAGETLSSAEQMARDAMSDNFVIGTEQILVFAGLLLVSLFLLSRQSKPRKNVKKLLQVIIPFPPSSSSSSLRSQEELLNAETPIRKSKSYTAGRIERSTTDSVICPDNFTGFIWGAWDEDDGMDDDASQIQQEDKFYTEHERFVNTYQRTIRFSEYRKLVLPPECKLLDPKKMQSSQQKDIAINTVDVWMKVVNVFHKIISLDYVGYTLHFSIRIFKALQYRWFKMWGFNVPEDDDDDDDDNTVASTGSRRSLISKEGSVAGSISQVQPTQNSSSNVSKDHDNEDSDTVDKLPSVSQNASIDMSIVQEKRTREKFHTADDHELNKLREKATIKPSPLRNQSTIYDDSFDISCGNSLEELPEDDIDENNWIPLDEEQWKPQVNGLSPIRSKQNTFFGNYVDSPNKYGDAIELSQSPQPKSKSQHEPSPKSLDSSLNIPSLPRRNTSFSINKKKDNLEKYRSAPKKAVIQSADQAQAPTDENDISDVQSRSMDEMVYFDSAANDASIRQLERLAPMPDREGYILGDQFLEDPRDTPLLVFVNTRSGSQQGPILKTQLRSLLNPIQVWDLADGGPEKILQSFSVFTRLRILVCGGDGTVSWIISTLDKMRLDRWPPIAILPLGTGNDLARIHGWGAGYANESLLMILDQVKESYISLLDRWTLTIESRKKKNSKSRKKESKPFINYMSIGMDAVSALQVHNLRENSPNMFFSRAVNKVWYALFGAEDAIKATCSDLPNQIVLEADGVEVPIPKDSQGLIFLNIDSYLGGVPLWTRGVPMKKSYRRPRERRYSDGDFDSTDPNGESFGKRKRIFSYDDSDSITGDGSTIEDTAETKEETLERITQCTAPSSCQDGKLDVITHRGNFNLGQIRVGLSNAQRLCQCSKVTIKMKKGTAVQVDGEPWKQQSGVLTIERQKDPAMMLHRALEEGGGIETEVANLLEWAEDKRIIDRNSHVTLMKEFSRRIEKKTRDRRNKTQETVFASVKKRIASTHRFPTVSSFE